MVNNKKKREKYINDVISEIKNRDEALTLLVGNQKGGVGKTTNSCLIAYQLAQKGVKTLVADLDPQANATKILVLTRDNVKDDAVTIKKTIYSGLKDGSLEDVPINIMDNLDLLPSHIDFKHFDKEVIRATTDDDEAAHFLKPYFEPLKKKYDVIILDTPPFIETVNQNGIVMSDFILISLQSQQLSLDGAVDFVNDTLRPLAYRNNLNIEVVGILPILVDEHNRADLTVLKQAREIFGEENMFKQIIYQRARIKRFPMVGISDDSMYEHRVMQMYLDVTDELIDRLGIFLGVDNNEQ